MKPLPKPMKSMCPGSSCPGCSSAMCMAKGGDVKGVHENFNKDSGESMAGTHVRALKEKKEKGESEGIHESEAKNLHSRVLRDMKSMKKPHGNFASGGYIPNPTEAEARSGYEKRPHMDDGGMMSEAMKLAPMAMMLMKDGGEVDSDGDHDGDSELMDAVSSELMSAIESKDKKGLLDAIRAIVLSCKE